MVDQKITRIKSRPENNNERLFRIGKTQSETCDFCNHTDNRQNIFTCPFAMDLIQPLKQTLRSCADSPTLPENLSCPSTLRLPLAFVTTEVLRAAYEWRMAGKAPNIIKTASSIKASSNIFVLSKKYSFASSIVQLWIGSYFAPGSQT